MVAAFAHLLILAQDAIHGARRTEVAAFVEEREIGLNWRVIGESFAVEHVEHFLAFGPRERARRAGAAKRCGRRRIRRERERLGAQRAVAAAIQRGARDAQRAARRGNADLRADGVDGLHQLLSPSSRLLRGMLRS